MSLFREDPKSGQEKGKLSSKRIIAFYLIGLFTVIVVAELIFNLTGISDTIKGAILGSGVSSGVSTLLKQNKEL